MCSCLTSFPGFFRYHLPLIKSIVTLFSSSFRSFHLQKLSTLASNPSSVEKLATKDVKVTLGSRVDGRGLFLDPVSVFATGPDSSPVSGVPNDQSSTVNENDATRREYYEGSGKRQQAPTFNTPTTYSHPEDVEVGLPDTLERSQPSETKRSKFGWTTRWKTPWQSDQARTGYWDILSVFRMDGAKSSLQSESYLGDISSRL